MDEKYIYFLNEFQYLKFDKNLESPEISFKIILCSFYIWKWNGDYKIKLKIFIPLDEGTSQFLYNSLDEQIVIFDIYVDI